MTDKRTLCQERIFTKQTEMPSNLEIENRSSLGSLKLCAGIVAPVLLYQWRGNNKHAVFMKTAVGNQNMQMRMKSEKMAERLYRDNSSEYRLLIPCEAFEKRFQSFPATATA